LDSNRTRPGVGRASFRGNLDYLNCLCNPVRRHERREQITRLRGHDRRPRDAIGQAVLGFGLGLRRSTMRNSERQSAIDWFEIISENYMLRRRPLRTLDRIARLSVVMHGVSLSIGPRAPISISANRRTSPARQPQWVSIIVLDGVHGKNLHDLLRSLHRGALDHVVSPSSWCRISSRALVLENVSTICSSTIRK